MDFDAWLQQKGHTGFLPDAVARKLYDEFVKEGRQWELKQDAQGNMVRANPQTGLVLAMTNEQGQPVKGANANPFADYAGPAGVAGASTVDTNSMAFQGVAPSAPQGAGSMGQGANPVAPVNVNPAVPAGQQGAGSMGQGVQTNAAPMFRSEDEVIAAARAGRLSKAQAQQILVNQFGLDP